MPLPWPLTVNYGVGALWSSWSFVKDRVQLRVKLMLRARAIFSNIFTAALIAVSTLLNNINDEP